MKRRFVTIAFVGLATLSTSAWALHRQTPFMLTASCKSQADPVGSCVPNQDSGMPFCQGSISRWVGFESTSDLMGNGSTGSEIFLFDNAPPRSLRQVTNAAQGDSHNPTTDSDAQLVAFDSSSDFLHNSITARQIFAWDKQTTQIQQLTFGNKDSIKPNVSAKGNVLAFESQADLIGAGTTGTNIFYWSPSQFCDFNGCRYIRQVTKLAAPYVAQHAIVGGGDTGPLVLFNSNGPVTGFTNGFQQIFLFERSTNHMYQLTAGSGDSTNATMDGTGRLVLFQSTADILHNGSTGTQLFLLDRSTGIFRQITNSTTGDSFDAWLGGGDRFIIFVSTADLKSTGSTGQHLFLYDLIYDELTQVTKGTSGSSGHPVATANTIFWFESSEDPMNLGLTGQLVYGLNVFGIVPLRGAGPQKFKFQPGQGTTGSVVRITTRDAVTTEPIGTGEIDFNVTGFDFDQTSGVQVGTVTIPPVPVPSFGAVCFTQTGPGTGNIDCNGGKAGRDVTALQDHDTDSAQDPLCLLGCRENDPSCQGQLLGPHFDPCPKCGEGTCSAGPNVGLVCESNVGCPLGECLNRTCDSGVNHDKACTVDSDCSPIQGCVDGKVPVCNGPVSTEFGNPYGPGDMAISVPLTAKISVDPGVDGKFCTSDDKYKLSNIGAILRLTTGQAAAGIIDADDIPNAALGTSEMGAPFSCANLLNKTVTGARMVGAISFLDVPTIPGLRDVILSWRFEAFAPPCTANCPQPCTQDSDCNDNNPCNGVEACVAGNCQPGAPISCSDGNACNGLETCDPATGTCIVGTAPNCDDGNPCTDDSCDPFFGCRHNPNTGTCDDGNACTTGDVCTGGFCKGTAKVCSDGNVCNGLETCDPGTGACLVGTPLNCDDGNVCTLDACNSASGCYHTPIPGSCDDGNLCTTGDTCAGGTCIGTPTVCSDGDPCNGIETCDPGTGGCLAGTPLVCDDMNPCTDDACVPGVGCVFTPNTNPCDDANACTENDVCANGVCAGTLTAAAVTCNAGDGDPCNGNEFCDSATGACLPGTPPSCDDSNSCTDDSCVAFTGCVHTPNDANACTDNNLCTTDVCSGGTCVSTDVACSNNNVCDGIETCDPGTGACLGGTPLNCDDFVACTTDSCDPVAGCQHDLPTGFPGVICLLDTMRATVNQAPAGTIAPKLKHRLLRMIDRTQNLVNQALTATAPKQLLIAKAGQKRFTSIIRVVGRALPRNSHAHQKISADTANSLTDNAKTGRDMLAAIVVP